VTTTVSSIDILNNNGLILGSGSNKTTIINTASGAQSLTLPSATDTVVCRATTDTLTNKTLIVPVISSVSNSGTVTLPTGNVTLVARTTIDTLTNKTLTAPVISTIVNSGTLTLPSTTDTLVARNTTDTLTNKTIIGAASGNSLAADQLATTGSTVAINNNVPSAGQALIATSATSASWSNITTSIPGEAVSAGTLQTTDATPSQTLETLAVPNGAVFYIGTKVVGNNTTTPAGFMIKIDATFYSTSGTVTVIGAPSAVSYPSGNFNGGDGYTIGDVVLAISGSNILITVTGQTGQTINWQSATSIVTV